MSLSPWEEQVLASLNEQLTGTDPELAALMDTFSRLAQDEHMPVREAIRGRSRRLHRRPRRVQSHVRPGFARRPLRRLGIGQAALLLWVVISVALIAVGVTLSRGDGSTGCPAAVSLVCASSVPSQTSSPADTGRASTHSQP